MRLIVSAINRRLSCQRFYVYSIYRQQSNSPGITPTICFLQNIQTTIQRLCTNQDPKLVPPISRQGILIGMTPSSWTLRLSLDPIAISSFRVTLVWGKVAELRRRNGISMLSVPILITIKLARPLSYKKKMKHADSLRSSLILLRSNLRVKSDGGSGLNDHWERLNRDLVQGGWFGTPIW